MKFYTPFAELELAPEASEVPAIPQPKPERIKSRVKVSKAIAPPPTPEIPEEEPNYGYQEHQGGFDYFLNFGFVSYGHKHLLLDRQILPFATVSSLAYRHETKKLQEGMRFIRTSIKMHTNQPQGVGEMVFSDAVPALGGFAVLDSASCVVYAPPAGLAGFIGRYGTYTVRPGALPALEMREILRKTDPRTLADIQAMFLGGPLRSQACWPSFFRLADPGVAGAVEMFDMAQKRWVWVIHLTHVSPVVLGAPEQLSEDVFAQLEAKIYRCFQFVPGPIYIGMRSIRPVGTIAGIGAVNEDQRRWLEQAVTAEKLPAWMVLHDLRFAAWAFPDMGNSQSGDRAEWERTCLNGRGKLELQKMLGNSF